MPLTTCRNMAQEPSKGVKHPLPAWRVAPSTGPVRVKIWYMLLSSRVFQQAQNLTPDVEFGADCKYCPLSTSKNA